MPLAQLVARVAALSALSVAALSCASTPPKPPVDHGAIQSRAAAAFDEIDASQAAPAAKDGKSKPKAQTDAKAPIGAAVVPQEPQPAWVTQKPGENEVLGEFEEGRTASDAIAAAKSKAFSELAMRAGVTVSANLEIKDQGSSSGSSSYEIRDTSKLYAVPLTVEKFEWKGTYARREERGFHAFALLQVPAEEFARIKRNLAGLVAFRLECDPLSSPKGTNLCQTAAMEKRMRELAVGRGMKLQNAALAEAPADLPQLGQAQQVAYYLDTKVEISKTVLDKPEYYVWVTLTWRLFHTDKGAALRELTVGPIKGGEYSFEAATMVAYRKALEALKEKLESSDLSGN